MLNLKSKVHPQKRRFSAKTKTKCRLSTLGNLFTRVHNSKMPQNLPLKKGLGREKFTNDFFLI